MKTTQWMMIVFAAGILVLTGCGKSQSTQPATAPMDIRGVKVDVPKMKAAMVNEQPQPRTLALDATSDIRYGKFADALAKLAKVASDPSLSEPTKKIVNDVIEQVKQLEAKNSPK